MMELYRYMLTNRRIEDKLSILYRQTKIVGGLYSSLGQEATSVGTAYALEDGDILAPMIRNLGSYLVRGVSVKDFVSQYTARACSPTEGKDGTAHFGDPAKGLIGCISMLGALIPVMMGVAMTMKNRNQPNVAMTYIGEGGTSTTDFHEGVNFAAVQKAPFILVMEHNQYAYSTHSSMQFPVKDLVTKAESYGCYGEKFDGNNILAAYDVAKRARDMCVAGDGPVLLESKTFRRKGHAEHDPAGYVLPKIRSEWEKKDPLEAYTQFVLEEKLTTKADLEAMEAEVAEMITREVDEVLESPFPDPHKINQDVYLPDANQGDPA